jgi:hypothetical protein
VPRCHDKEGISMSVRKVFIGLLAASLLTVGHAFAQELRDNEAHLAINVPDSWDVTTRGKWAFAHTKDETVHLGLRATDGGWKADQDLESRLQAHVNEWLSSTFIDEKWKHFDHNNYEGYEAYGHGKNDKGEERKFLILAVRDKKDHKKGAVLFLHGTPKGWEEHHRGIREGVKTLRSW